MTENTSSKFSLDTTGATFAFLLFRLWLGTRSFATGIEKFAGIETRQTPLLDEFGEEDISGAMVTVKAKVYGFEHYHGLPKPLFDKFAEEPLMPLWMLNLYSSILGYALILLGILLFTGALPRLTLFASGLLYTSLTVGLILLNESGGVAWLATHIIMIAAALLLVKYNKFSLYNKL